MSVLAAQKSDSHLLHADVTRPVIGSLFGVFKELGYGFQEKYYQRALAIRLDQDGVGFQREQMHPILFEGRIIGRYFVDFVIEKKVVLELKVAPGFYESFLKQVLGYLKTTGLKVGILAIITPQGVKIKRIVA